MPRVMSIAVALCVLACAVVAAPVSSFARKVQANGKTFAVRGVRVELKAPGVAVRLGLAWDHVARIESLASLAKRQQAVAAINGSFFDAYSRETLRNPDMALVTGGALVYKSELGTLLGFEADNTPHLARVRYRLQGTVTPKGRRAQEWFAYWLNRRPTSEEVITIFTRHWGATVEGLGGTSVVVENGVVTAITPDAAAIPAQGYVIHVRGNARQLALFEVGAPVTYEPSVTMLDGDPDAWARVQEAVGAGPRVLRDGEPVFDPAAEGFSDPKILERAGARSAAGFTADGTVLLLITTTGATVVDLGHLLKALGCADGLNLDGGASSGLWYNGDYLTTPGRQIGNGLLVSVD